MSIGKPSTEKSKIYIGIPTGDSKEYAMLYMLASLRNIDYPPDQIIINFAITHLGNTASELFLRKVKTLLQASNFKCETRVHITHPTMEDMTRWGPYYAVITNIHAMRLDFIESDCDYFWLLGGDNPPPRGTLQKLLDMNIDVASAMINQRMAKLKKWDIKETDEKGHRLIYPAYWTYVWTLEELDKMKLEPRLKQALRLAWVEFMFLKTEPPPPEERILYNSVFGSGCSLVKRECFETIGYYLGEGGTHSEDLQFCSLANAQGFKTAINLDTRCMHFDEDGRIY